MKSLLIAVCALAALPIVAACGDDGGSSGPPALAVGEVVVVEPGGDTICSRGTPYRFGARGGDTKRIVIDFQGGGACWNELTCSVAEAIFFEEATGADALRTYLEGATSAGIYQLDDADNPVEGWTFVHIPYCTGDIHWGNAVVDYNDDIRIEHRGFVNTQAVLDWVYARYPDPDQILVTGCSAGAYGAIGHAARIAEHYPKAKITVLGDSGAGIITDTFFAESFPRWNAEPTLPMHLADLADKRFEDLNIIDLYTGVARAFPDRMRVAQYNTAFDRDQTFFYTVMGGGDDWGARMMANLAAIDAATTNFTSYTGAGPVHCISPYPFFYDRVSGPAGAKVAYTDWLSDLIDGDALPAPVTCADDDCTDDHVCNACADDNSSSGPVCRWCAEWNE